MFAIRAFTLAAFFSVATFAAPLAEKRFDNARFTYYDAGENACGSTDSDSAYVSDQCSRRCGRF